MRNPIVSPRFDEESYKGQDVVHAGIRIPLKGYMPLDLLVKFSRRAQRIIKLPADDYTGIKYFPMLEDELADLRALWFDPEDKTFPTHLDNHIGITARKDGKIIGGVIWAFAGKNLFLHQLISGPEGKELQLPTLLIWQSVIMYCAKQAFHSLDIGVSYNPKRYEFFKNFAVETYPIILKKPFYVPVIRLAPFRVMNPMMEHGEVQIDENATFLPRGNYALFAALKHAGVGPGDLVSVVKTFGSNFLTGCVSSTIEKTGAEWKLRDIIRTGTKAVVVVHEFGISVYQEKDMEIIEHARSLGIAIIEDCAWRSYRVWDWSTYAIFSLQKMYPINYGGLLIGAKIDDETLWSWGCLDIVKRERITHEAAFDAGDDTRKRNWQFYHALAMADGMQSDDCYDYAAAVEAGTWIPTVYMQKFESDEIADAIVARLEEFGIQAGRYWGEPVVYLPIHQNMTTEEIVYMFAVVKGYFNLCRDYGKIKA